MKKIATLFLLGVSSFSLAQSFALYKTNGSGAITATVTNGYNITEVSTPSAQVNTKIRIKNNAASTQTFNVIRTVISQSPLLDLTTNPVNPTTYFCFGYTCFNSSVNSAGPQDYAILAASGQTSTTFPNADNSDANGQPFSIYLEEGSTTGIYVVKYKVFRTDNPNDTVSFTISYNGPAGIKDYSKASLSFFVYPNPSSQESNIYFNSDNSSDVNVILTNVAGQVVYDKKYISYVGQNAIKLNCEGIPSGIYSISLKKGDVSVSRKLVVSK